jgi:hypothetical protein
LDASVGAASNPVTVAQPITVLDSGPGGNNGTIYGGVTSTPGIVGQAFSFNGQGSYVDLGTGAGLVGTGAFALAAWVRTSADGVIVQQRDAGQSNGQYQLAVSGGKVYFWTYAGGAYGFNFTSNASVNDGQWHLIVAQRLANGTGQIFIDGALDNSQAAAPVALGGGIHVYLGEDVRDAVNNFVGQIDQVQIYGGSLSPVDVQAQYNARGIGNAQVLPATLPGLVGWYQGKNGAQDSSPLGNGATPAARSATSPASSARPSTSTAAAPSACPAPRAWAPPPP